jgi:hypothetical protein
MSFSSRSAVLGCYISEQQFLEQEGIFLLLDLLQVTKTLLIYVAFVIIGLEIMLYYYAIFHATFHATYNGRS